MEGPRVPIYNNDPPPSSADMPDTFYDGCIVALRHQGRLLTSRLNGEQGFELCSESNNHASTSGRCLPGDALFVIKRHGHQFALRALGADGRWIQAEQGIGGGLRLSSGLTQQGLWEVFGGQVVNAYWRHKELEYDVEDVTVVPTAQLAQAEREQHLCMKELQARLRCLEKDGIEAKLARWSTDSSLCSFQGGQEVEDLRQRLEGAYAELETTKSELQSAIRQRDEEREMVAKLLDERQRVESAFRCIKGMTEDQEEGDTVEEDQCLSIGIPVESTSATSADVGSISQNIHPNDEISLANYSMEKQQYSVEKQRKEDHATSAAPTLIAPASISETTAARLFDAHTLRAKSIGSQNSCSWFMPHNYEPPHTSRSDEDHVDEQNNKVEIGSCVLVDYAGKYHPNTINDESMERLLDAPLPSSRLERGDSLFARPSSGRAYISAGELRSSWAPPPPPRSRSASPDPIVEMEHSKWLTSATSADWSDQIEEPALQPVPTSQAVAALESGSPDTANLLTQYMADHVTHHRASLPSLDTLKMSGKFSRRDLRSSSSSGGYSKRSSFLNRALVADSDLYG